MGGAELVKFSDGSSIANPDFRSVSPGVDPITAMKYTRPDHNDVLCKVNLLKVAEINQVASLEFVNTDADNEKYTCSVPTFTVVNSKLNAAVNLRHGDSGGPVFAVMVDGTMRLCGVISGGNPREGGGNIISFCYHSEAVIENADEDTVAHELVAAELAAELEWGRDEDHREGHTTKRKRVKSSHKDKAARKRTLNLCKLLWEKLKQVYSRKDARIIFDVIMRGNVPTLSNRDYIQGVEDDSWLISDSLPDPNWT